MTKKYIKNLTKTTTKNPIVKSGEGANVIRIFLTRIMNLMNKMSKLVLREIKCLKNTWKQRLFKLLVFPTNNNNRQQ